MADMFKRFLISALIVFTSFMAYSTNEEGIDGIEDRIVQLIDSIESTSNFNQKNELNNELLSLLYDALLLDNSFEYPFNKVQKMGILTSPDKKVRVYTWNIPQAGGHQKYFGFIQTNVNQLQNIYPLTDNRKQIETPQLLTLSTDTWHGALYYSIRVDNFFGKNVYTLLGVDMNNLFSTKRIIEIITLSDNGEPQLGAPVFRVKGNILNRIVFEFSAKASMILRWNEEMQMIVFDHLTPMRNDYAENYQFYVPDSSYDGFKLTELGWEYKADIDVRNPDRAKPPTPIKPPVENPEPGFLYQTK
ncbi:MAG: hypothetical protein PHD06_13175 [Bacteroidales bacterium]|jgi:hypothetical protein|nr:hypothetical protein [Bacteroidales bacterium]MDD4386120.1 hypothetical protein [Bacteroidales bacterium]MDY0197446.1 hypothetical protein [Tenuifilaceae bacterium]